PGLGGERPTVALGSPSVKPTGPILLVGKADPKALAGQPPEHHGAKQLRWFRNEIDREVGAPGGPRRPCYHALAMPLRRLCSVLTLAIVSCLVPMAYASPPDQTWISGITDNADHDDAVILITSALGMVAAVL